MIHTRYEYNVLSFRMIRRAVEAARKQDAAHKLYEAKYGASFTSEHKRTANEIRAAIRAAISTHTN